MMSTLSTAIESGSQDAELAVLRAILEGTAHTTGAAFLENLVRQLAITLSVPHAFVAEFADVNTRVRTLALWVQGRIVDNREFDIEITPCREVVRGELCHYPSGLASAYPNPTVIAQKLDSFLGVPLRTAKGEHLGHLAIADSRPMPKDPRLLSIFRIFAARAAAELERVRIEKKLSRVTAITETASDFVSLANLAGEILYINPAGLQLIGRSGEDPTRLRVSDLLFPDRSVPFDSIVAAVKERGTWSGERYLRHKDGRSVPVSQVVTLIRDQAGAPIGLGSIAHDITEHQQTLLDLQRAKEGAEAASRAKSAFLAKMSHELRTPLNVILGFTQLLCRDSGLSPDHREYLGIIQQSGAHLLALINDTLEMSKIEAGRVSLLLQGFDLYDLLDGVEAMLRLHAEDKGLSLRFERGADTPRFIRTDKGKLRQILLNLMGNAIKFTQRGSVVLHVRPSAAAESPSRLHFVIEDTGPGIANEELPTLFDAFVQAEAGRRSQEGTGLGLPICQQFARLLGGAITVHSEPGRGSRFSFDIQVEAADPVEGLSSAQARRVTSVAPGQPEYRILVVEDRWQNRVLLTKLLSSVGFVVQEAADGREAIAAWENFAPHLIWMDMAMPVMDGFEATRRIKATARGRETIIIALTASAFEEDREIVLAEGCDDFVRKPFQEEIIFEKMAQYLGVRYIHAEEATPSPPVVGAQPALAPTDFLDLPAAWIAELRQAAVQLDQERVLDLTEHIRERAPMVAQALSVLAESYEYAKILQAIGSA
jgi:PAS domain S-box-containing protein